jgi:hypothetical protein
MDPHSFAAVLGTGTDLKIEKNLQVNLASCLSKRLWYLRIGLAPWIRIRIETTADPQHWREETVRNQIF